MILKEFKKEIKKIIVCKECKGTGEMSGLDGFKECLYCGGEGHCIEELDGYYLKDILKVIMNSLKKL